jgi:hypothetical protein
MQGVFLLGPPASPRNEAKARSEIKSTAPIRRSAKTIAEFRAAYGFSPNTWKRLRRAGDIPRLTWLTQRKAIILPQHEQSWLDARTDPVRDNDAA